MQHALAKKEILQLSFFFEITKTRCFLFITKQPNFQTTAAVNNASNDMTIFVSIGKSQYHVPLLAIIRPRDRGEETIISCWYTFLANF